MCRLLNIVPFEYAMKVRIVYNKGTIIPKEVVQMTPESVLVDFQVAVRNLTAVSLEVSLPNALSVPHMLSEVFRNMLYIGASADLKFDALE